MLYEMTSYQRLKSENAKLKEEILKLVMEPESLDGIRIAFKYKIGQQMTNAIWFGKPSVQEHFHGIVK